MAFVESRADLGIQHAAAAHASESHVGLDHADHFELTQNFFHSIGRVWPDGSKPYETDFQALIAHMLNRKTCGHRVRALQEKNDVGPIGHELFDPGIVSPPKNVREFVVDLLDHRHRIFHGARAL